MELDHVLLAVPDLEAAASELDARYGLASVEGGRHPGWGTANRIVPLGDSYLELIAVVDANEAGRSAFGRWVAEARAEPFEPLGWAVRTGELEAVARVRGLEIGVGSRTDREGRALRWRFAGVDQAVIDPTLPFFIEWIGATPFPGRVPASHRGGPFRLSRLGLAGDVGQLAAWLGPHQLPISIQPGEPAVTEVVLAGAGGELALSGVGS